MINLLIVEDNDIIRNGLAALINGTDGYLCKASFANCESFLESLPKFDVDLVLMDIGLPGISGIEGIKEAKKIKPNLNILMLTVHEEREVVFEALCAGACGYLMKTTPPVKLLEAIKDVTAGGSPMSSNIARQVITVFQQKNQSDKVDDSDLSTRELDVLKLLCDGRTYSFIATSLFISIDTVRHHIRNIYKKLHVHSQAEAVAKALKKGIV